MPQNNDINLDSSEKSEVKTEPAKKAKSSDYFGELRQLLEENLQLSRQNTEALKKIQHWIAWQKVWGWLKILVIIVPIILGLIYLPALLGPVIKSYQELLGFSGKIGSQDLLNQLIGQVKNGASQ